MNLYPKNQYNLYGLNNELSELIDLYKKKKLPNKILLSGKKGSGKCTLAYHLINFIFSINEKHSYNQSDFLINNKNKSLILVQNGTHPNFFLIDILKEKKNIDINQIRDLIIKLNKSSFNSKPKIILIDNIEFLNLNSVNSLLKVLEEPNDNTYFILINNNKKVLPTLKSRCINYKISLSNKKSVEITNRLIGESIYNVVNKDFLNYYFTPGNILNLINFSKESDFDLKKTNLKNFLKIIIKENIYKKESNIKYLIYEFIEQFISCKSYNLYDDYYFYFLRKIDLMKKFNLDEESIFIELQSKILNE